MKELALHVMDVMQNSITAGSSHISVEIEVCRENALLRIMVKDDGCGMDEETLRKATDPFHTSRTTRIVGLGLPMLKEAAELTGGGLTLESEPGRGTVLRAEFMNQSIDRQPLGNLGNVFFLLMLSYEKLSLDLTLSSERGSFCFQSQSFAALWTRRGESHMEAAFAAEEWINEQARLIFREILPEMGGDLNGVEGNRQIDQRQAAL